MSQMVVLVMISCDIQVGFDLWDCFKCFYKLDLTFYYDFYHIPYVWDGLSSHINTRAIYKKSKTLLDMSKMNKSKGVNKENNFHLSQMSHDLLPHYSRVLLHVISHTCDCVSTVTGESVCCEKDFCWHVAKC